MGRIRDNLKRIPKLPTVIWQFRKMGQSLAKRVRLLLGDVSTQRLRKLRNAYKGRRGWVVGNGPSLTQLDLSLLSDEVTFCANGIWLLFDQLQWRPTFYVVEDGFVAEDNAETINAIHGPIKVFPRDLQTILTSDENTFYVDFVRGDYPGFPCFSDRCDQEVFWGGTVTYMCLQLAHYLGCNPIYLIGMDMSYKVPDYVEKDGITIVSREADVNHFHPDYFGPGKRWHHPRVDRMFRCLEHAAQHLSAQGVRVYNATSGGKLEVFPRAQYEDVFKKEPCRRLTMYADPERPL